MEERDAEQAPVLALGHGALVERERLEQAAAVADMAMNETTTVIPMTIQGTGNGRPGAPAAGEVATRRADVARFLGQPAEPGRDLRPIGRGRPALGLAIGRDRPVQVALADARRSDLAPGPVGARRLWQLEDRLPGRDRLALAIEPVERLPEAQQRRRRHRRVVEADHAPVVDRGVTVLAGVQQLGRAVEDRARRFAAERALDRDLRSGGERRGRRARRLGHGPRDRSDGGARSSRPGSDRSGPRRPRASPRRAGGGRPSPRLY